MLSERNQWRVRRIVAGLYWSVAATLVVIVIPPVMMDAFPEASPAAAGLAFAISAILNACLGFSVANPDVPLPGSRKEGIRAFPVHPGKLKTEIAAVDADVAPRAAALKFVDWVESVDREQPCGCYDLMTGELIEW